MKEQGKRVEEKEFNQQKAIRKVTLETKVCRLISRLKKAIKTVIKIPLSRVNLKAKNALVRKINQPQRKHLAKSKRARKEKKKIWE